MAGYLVVILLLQGLAAALALGAGPLHQHLAINHRAAAMVFSHHDHHHATGQRHDHDSADSTVLRDAADQEAAEAARQALAVAMSLLALQSASAEVAPLRHVLMATRAWFWRSLNARALFRPPRRT